MNKDVPIKWRTVAKGSEVQLFEIDAAMNCIQNCGRERFGATARLRRMMLITVIGLGGVENPRIMPQRSQAVLISSKSLITRTTICDSWKGGPAPAQTNFHI
jgi:hypothetical protein